MLWRNYEVLSFSICHQNHVIGFKTIKFTPKDAALQYDFWVYIQICSETSYTENDPHTPSYPNIPPPQPQQSPSTFTVNFFAKLPLHWIFSTLFYIKYWLFWYRISLCCNFFYGYPKFATFLLNYYKKSSNDKIFDLKFKKIRQRFLCTRPVFSDFLFASYD